MNALGEALAYMLVAGCLAVPLGIVASIRFANPWNKFYVLAGALGAILIWITTTNDRHDGPIVEKVLDMALLMLMAMTVPFVAGFVLAKVVGYLRRRRSRKRAAG